MDYQNQPPRRRKSQSDRRGILNILAILFVFISILIVIQAGSRILGDNASQPNSSNPGSSGSSQMGGTNTENSTPGKDPETTPTEPTTPPPPHVISTASIGVTGDVLVHGPVIRAAQAASGKAGEYDFTGMFQYIKPYFERYDYMVANLETTLGGTEAGEYKGYPAFNCPDSMVDALQQAGVDMLLTANNHSYDTGYKGFIRTQKVISDRGMDYLGTQLNADDVDYTIKNINGIQVGMICYTYETTGENPDRKYLNGNPMTMEAVPLISSFNYEKLSAFYTELEQNIKAMEAAGAEATMVYIHWGEEYYTSPRDIQKTMAQKLCEIGVDVIVGGHPHVIEPFTTLTSSTGEKTYCIYSVGNAISNQNRVEISATTAHENNKYTEDGMIFGVTFQKWSNGIVEVAEIDILPTWVNNANRQNYTVIPLDPSIAAWNGYDVSKVSSLVESYNRTMGIVGNGLNLCRAEFGLEEVVTTVNDK